MKRLQLIAITPRQDNIPDGMKAVVANGLSAVYAPLPRHGRLTRRGLLRSAARRQWYLEQLLPAGAVLPVLPGQNVPVAEAGRMLRANAPELARRLEDLAGKVQFQVTFAMDEANALAHLSCISGPYSAAQDLADLRARLARHFDERLQSRSSDVTMLPVADGLVANAVLLVDTVAEAALHETIADFDAVWPEGFRFRLVGPSPAVSFASVEFRKAERQDIVRARAILKLSTVHDASDIAKARQDVLREGLVPAEKVRVAAEIATSAVRLQGEDGQPLYRVKFWAEGMAMTAPVSLREAA